MSREARRIHKELGPDEESRLRQLRKQVQQELPDMIERDQLRKTASEENNLSGELRRRVHRSEIPLSEIARQCGIELLELDEFLTGERTLSSDVVSRLVEILGCKLVSV